MDLTTAQMMARNLMREHGVTDAGWRFEWDRAVKRLGATHFRARKITLSQPLTLANDEATVRNTMLHEIAHVLAGARAAHGPEWRAVARRIGCDARATNTTATLPEMPWNLVCPNCGKRSPRARRTKTVKACGVCCGQFNNGRFDSRFIMSWERNENQVLASR